MRRGLAGAGMLLLAACAGPVPAGPEQCRIAPVATMALRYGRFTVVDGALNGKPAALLLDTGAEGSAVTDRAVRALLLERLRRMPVRVSGIGGVATVETASARVGLGGDETWREMPVLDLPVLAGQPIAALLGVNVLARYDMEVSFPERRVRLWETQGCVGRYAPWGGGYWSVPLELTASGRPLLTVSIDGQPVSALLDTGASVTTLQRDKALALGVSEAALAADRSGTSSGIDGVSVPTRQHRFAAVGVGPERFDDQPIAVAPMSRIGAEMLLGVDWLQDRRIWISWRNRVLFVQPAPAIQPPAPGSAAALAEAASREAGMPAAAEAAMVRP